PCLHSTSTTVLFTLSLHDALPIFQSHRLFRDADAILTCNATEAALLKERYPHKQIVVQPHGVPLHLYETDHREAARTAFPEICGRSVLLNAGRIDPIKNQGWLLAQAAGCLQRQADRLLVLAGPCSNAEYGRQLRQQIHAL